MKRAILSAGTVHYREDAIDLPQNIERRDGKFTDIPNFLNLPVLNGGRQQVALCCGKQIVPSVGSEHPVPILRNAKEFYGELASINMIDERSRA